MGKLHVKDWDTLRAMDMNPKTGERNTQSGYEFNLLGKITHALRVFDQQNAINRYTWYNLPSGLTGQFIESILYYKGRGCLFYVAEEDRFYFLPYVLEGTIDVYGRYTGIKPLPYTGKAEDDKGVFIPDLVLTPQYEVLSLDKLNMDIFKNGAVILYDYSKQYSQTISPRKDLQEPFIRVMAECLPMARTSLVRNSGIAGIKVDDPDQGWVVSAAGRAMFEGALADTPTPLVPIASEIQMESLTDGGSALKGEEYLLMMQGVDNLRLSMYGLKNGGLFQKKAHMLEAEAEMNDGNVGLIYQDGLTLRQNFCDIVNSIWGLGISVEPSECVVGLDRNGDMMVADNKDQSGTTPGEQPANVGGDDAE